MAKVLVSMDDKLLALVDRAARAAGLTRSAYLARLAARELGMERGPGADPRVRRAMTELDKLFRRNPVRGDMTAAVRAERNSH